MYDKGKPCPDCGVAEGLLHYPECAWLKDQQAQDSTKIVQDSAKPPAAGMGRPKGAQNKITREIKQMVIEALDNAGGVDYLVTQSRDNPTAFLTLVGKVLPLQVAGDINHAVKVSGALAWKPQQ